jgi:hypothetical protein
MKSRYISQVIAFVAVAIAMFGCTKSDDGDFERVAYIDGFPVVENLDVENAVDVLNAKNVIDIDLASKQRTYSAVHPNGDKVAEFSGFDANICIWNISGDGETSVVRKNIANTDDAIERRIADREPIYGGGCGYKNFFTVYRLKYAQTGEQTGVSVEFISWEGEALGCINISSADVQRVYVDLSCGDIYIFDAESNTVKRMDISSFLSKIKV